MPELTPMERRAIEMLLAGDHPALNVLRKQAQSATVSERQFMCSGLFTPLVLPPDVERLGSARLVLRDVNGVAPNGRVFGFILFVAAGAISKLECHDYGSGAPIHAEPEGLRLHYVRRDEATDELVEAPERELAQLELP